MKPRHKLHCIQVTARTEGCARPVKIWTLWSVEFLLHSARQLSKPDMPFPGQQIKVQKSEISAAKGSAGTKCYLTHGSTQA